MLVFWFWGTKFPDCYVWLPWIVWFSRTRMQNGECLRNCLFLATRWAGPFDRVWLSMLSVGGNGPEFGLLSPCLGVLVPISPANQWNHEKGWSLKFSQVDVDVLQPCCCLPLDAGRSFLAPVIFCAGPQFVRSLDCPTSLWIARRITAQPGTEQLLISQFVTCAIPWGHHRLSQPRLSLGFESNTWSVRQGGKMKRFTDLYLLWLWCRHV